MSKYFRDPIHDLIRVDDDHMVKVIDTAPIQRLRSIRQLGLANLVYPGAEHSRFTHSLGVLHLANRIIEKLDFSEFTKDQKDREKTEQIFRYAALLHDIGHGPFSHFFEVACKKIGLKFSHTRRTRKIIKEYEPLNKLLSEVYDDLPNQIQQVFEGTHPKSYLVDLISSQLDIDRLDYLLRDTAMTGVKYGYYDLEWMIRVLKIKMVKAKLKGQLDNGDKEIYSVVANSDRGTSVIDQYIIGRNYMYRHVYYHKTIRAFEGILAKIMKRMFDLLKGGNGFEGKLKSKNISLELIKFLKDPESLTIEEFLLLNDNTLNQCIDQFYFDDAFDPVLHKLSKNLKERKPFKNITPYMLGNQEYSDINEKAKTACNKLKLEIDYYIIEDSSNDAAYKDYSHSLSNDEQSEEIILYDSHKKPELYSDFGEKDSLLKSLKFANSRIFVPQEVADIITNEG